MIRSAILLGCAVLFAGTAIFTGVAHYNSTTEVKSAVVTTDTPELAVTKRLQLNRRAMLSANAGDRISVSVPDGTILDKLWKTLDGGCVTFRGPSYSGFPMIQWRQQPEPQGYRPWSQDIEWVASDLAHEGGTIALTHDSTCPVQVNTPYREY